MVHAAAFRSYFATHPEVTGDMVELEKILGTWPSDKKPPSEP